MNLKSDLMRQQQSALEIQRSASNSTHVWVLGLPRTCIWWVIMQRRPSLRWQMWILDSASRFAPQNDVGVVDLVRSAEWRGGGGPCPLRRM